MAINWGLYQRGMSAEGESRRDRLINQTQNLMVKLSSDGSAFKECVNGTQTIYLNVMQADDISQKKIYSMPGCNDDFKLGDIITWASRYWLVTKVDADDEVCRRGEMEECNHLFRWQNGTSTIHETYGIITSTHRATIDGNVLTELATQLRLVIPCTDATQRWFKGKRIGIDSGYNRDGELVLVAYEILSILSVTSDYGNGKYLTILAQFSEASKSDSVAEMIADYIPATDPVTLMVAGPDKLRAGGSPGHYTSTVTTEYTWEVRIAAEYAEFVTSVVNEDGSLTVQIADTSDAIIGQELQIAVICETETILKVVGVTSIYG